MRYLNKIFIPIYVLIIQLFVVSVGCSSFQWEAEPVSLTSRRETVEYLNKQLEVAGADTEYVVNPNIAVASVTVNMKDIKGQDVKLEVDLPYFFLSGWGRDNYKNKVRKDIINFIHGHMYYKNFKHFLSYKTSMLEDFYRNIGGYKSNLQHMHGLEVDGMSEDEFNRRYLHSEQALFIFCQEELPKIQAELEQILGSDSVIQNFIINILSYRPICQDCKTTADLLAKESSKILNTTAFFTFNFEDTILSNPGENKRKSLDHNIEESKEKSLSPKKRKAEGEEHQPESLGEKNSSVIITSEHVEKWDDSKDRRLVNILSSLSYGNHKDLNFIEYLIPLNKYPEFRTCIEILRKKPIIVRDLFQEMSNFKTKKGLSPHTPTICNLLNAYIHIFINKNIQGKHRVRIIKSMNNIITEFKSNQKMCKSPSGILLYAKTPTRVPGIEPEYFIFAKIAERFIELLSNSKKALN